GADRSGLWAGVPVVDGGVELDAGIGGGPGRMTHPVPEFAGLDRLDGLAAEPRGQLPVVILEHALEKLIGDAHRIVGVLPRDREVGLAVPVGVVARKLDALIALARELDDAADVGIRYQVAARLLDGALEGGVLAGIEAGFALGFAIDAGLENGLQSPLTDLGPRDEGGDLLFLLHLPVDVGLDVGMVDVDHHHLGGATGGASRLDGAGRAVADLEKAHKA